MNRFVVITKTGARITFTNEQGWEAFLHSMLVCRALISPNGFYIPIESIDHVAPEMVPEGAKTMADVIHLVTDPPKGAA